MWYLPCEPLVNQPIVTCVSQHPHLQGLELADFPDTASCIPIDMLIGSDYYWELVTGSVCRGVSGPTAIHTKLGWVLSGPACSNPHNQCTVNLSVTHVLHIGAHEESNDLVEQLRAFWELESLGIQEEESTLYNQFEGTIKFENGRYKVPLPWKEYHDTLPDNYQPSLSRLHGLLRRLRQDPAICKEYDSVIKEQLKGGIIEAVPADRLSTRTVHYLPHHAVIRQDKSTTKLRIVYDASAKSARNPSLNDCLLKGPSFNQLIFDLLVRFRSYRVALVADIEKAFLMISVDEADRDVLRFIWVDDINSDTCNLKIYRFTRVVFGVSASPFLLNATIRFHLEKHVDTNKAVVTRLLHSTYVDDIISGANTEEEAFNLYVGAKAIFQKEGFNLRKFLTNSHHLQNRNNQREKEKNAGVAPGDTIGARVNPGTSQTPCGEHKVLGVSWDPDSDQLIFDITSLAHLAQSLHPTKRSLIGLIGKFYDPLGFLSPVVIRFKLILQELYQHKADWDEAIPAELLKKWRNLTTDLSDAKTIYLPRCYFGVWWSNWTCLHSLGFVTLLPEHMQQSSISRRRQELVPCLDLLLPRPR